ncbi:uncharacterized protein LOC125043188 isoform X2 [Penaeus chinensis]|uniref:uncharacterized protein LOC125043188 isoform X2 n=1 Tax=Penaeus chinensis TaxID=139456 RepID=UPI001FB7D382|nr:uncharacterized protein LOC125043188 isoform X2 [Penaeus chinensis]
MEAAVYASLVVSFCLWNFVSASPNYELYQLESFRMCGFGGSEASVYISPWDAIILRVGDDFQAARNIHRCKVRVKTKEGFGLAAVIEDMRIRGRKDKETNGWLCEDYVKMSTSGSSIFYKFLDTVLPGDLFKSKTTKELCGTQQNKGDSNSSFTFSEVGTNANILSTLNSDLTLEFHQDQSNDNPVNNTFTIVITTYKHVSDKEACQGKYLCKGSSAYQYCIHPRYECDSHFNCAFPYSSGSDEQRCRAIQHPIFSITTIIITTLATIVGLGLIVCCLFTFIMRARSRTTTPTGTPIEASAPPLQRQHTLPHYEAVVKSDGRQGWGPEDPPSPNAFPPSYHALFPNGPPSDLAAESDEL